MKILIVDDNTDSRVLLEKLLKSRGYDVLSASNGVEALEKISLYMPDLIISDILMPEMDGFELCRRVKTDQNLSKIPFVFYTATFVDRKDERLALSLGASRFLIKLMEPDIFLNIIEEVLEEYMTNKLPVPEGPLVDLAELDRMQIEALTRKLDKKVRELENKNRMLLQSQLEWKSIFQAIGSPTIVLDTEHNIISANRATIKAVGVSSEKDLIGKKCYEIFHNTTESSEGCPLQKLLLSGSFEQSEIEVEAFGGIFHVSCIPVFDDFDDSKSIKQIIHIATDIRELKETEKNLYLQQKLLMAINRGQQNFIAEEDKNTAFESLLSDILEITNSEYGFIGEVLYTQEGKPYLKIYAITNISWDEKTLKLYNEYAQRGFEFYNLNTLYGYTLLTGEPVISEDPLNDPRSGGLPDGHPPLKAYLGLPIVYGDKMVAMLGIANRPGGYTEEEINFLQPLLNTIGQLVTARRILEEKKFSEESLRRIESLLSHAMKIASLGYWEYDVVNDIFTFNDNFYALFRTTAAQVGGYTMSLSEYANRFIHHEDRGIVAAEISKAIETKDPNFSRQLEHRIIYADGNIGYMAVRYFVLKDEQGKTVKTFGINQDITELKLIEKTLKDNEDKLKGILRVAPIGIGITKDRVLLEVNDMICRITGYSREELLNKSARILYPSDEEFNFVGTEKYRMIREEGIGTVETKWKRKDGQIIDILLASTPLEMYDMSKGVVFTALDITARKKAEQALNESLETYRKLFDDHIAAKLLIDPDTGEIIDANKAASNFYGWSREELKRMKIQEITVSPFDELNFEEYIEKTLKKTSYEGRHRLSNGSIKDVRVYSSKIPFKGKDYIHSTVHDITKEKELEAQLFQSQKLESIGRLAGGIAHDFNNMLNIILGYGEIILNKLNQRDPLYKDVDEIVKAAERSMALTNQLLAFSRKQILKPKVLNINEILKSMKDMLQRLIGEDIEVIMELKEDLSNVEADPAQIEQVIMNLSVNARDAMPFGGKLIIETANVVLDENYIQSHAGVIPGDYVMISVTDTGHGMDKETLAHIFEPFFTTKEKGTGLGLSTVYGIVKQSGGHIWVYSELGKGTTFKIYLPVTLTKPETELEDKQTEKIGEKVGGGHILVVEDEPALRGLFEVFLTSLGYKVTLAANGGEALLLVEEKGLRPDLVITDVIMPIMSGAVLAERLRKIQPDLKVLFMSGYTDNAIVHHGVLDPDTPFIQKPFNIAELAKKINEMFMY
ncbi:MAG: PAS domain S-box protein [Thermodesulfovibrionales bacterium]|nr:PAS domain S-box protein [Thermodesulfovibrionales bacterium]